MEGSDRVKVLWFCGTTTGPPEWQGTEFYECPTCETEFETLEPLEDWKEEACFATCPSCGAELSQSEDEPVVAPESAFLVEEEGRKEVWLKKHFEGWIG